MTILEAEFSISLVHPPIVMAVSDGVEALLGFTPDDFLSGSVTLPSRIHAGDQDFSHALFSRDMPFSGSFPIRLRQENGRIRIVRLDYSKTRSEPENDLQLTLRLQDIKSLFQASPKPPMMANFKSMMENTDDFIFFKDENHIITGASQTLAAICPPNRHWTDLIGQTDYDIFPEVFADIYYELEKQIYAGMPIAKAVQHYTRKDGSEGCVDNRKYPILNDDSKIIGLFGIARDISEQKRLHDELEYQAHTDFLTGLRNRRNFIALAEEERCRAILNRVPLSLLMIDIDYFKQVNDTHGHQVGDAVLVKLAKVCQQTLRNTDIMGRIGGEEFAILLPESDEKKAMDIAERIRKALANTDVPLITASHSLRFTVSIGLAVMAFDTSNIDVLLGLADKALYEAKNTGRNRVCVSRA